MEFVRLGASDLVVSRLGLGGCPMGGHGWGSVEDRDSIRAVHVALDAGINFFDTADVYGLGHSEQVLSQALGDRRHEVVIATKFGVRWDSEKRITNDIRPAYMRQALEASLKRLRVESIPLYYVHWPDGQTAIEDTVAELQKCREEGKIREIGVSNFDSHQLITASQVSPIAGIQVELSLLNRRSLDLSDAVHRTNSTLITWGSLAQGLLTGKYNHTSKFAAGDRRNRYPNFQGEAFQRNLKVVEVVKEVAKRYSKTPAQVAIRWLLDTESVGVVLFGAKTESQVDDNLGGSDWSLEEHDYNRLNQASEQLSKLAA
ncbi:aldo/keto reductase [Aeoliella mucimassa]|uniref:General stress protein 69 n=1 Tax=Aeoliella mucimassa TaxID=2527972 RepID=A0A518AKS9_9BACT|nr:aldo/keto reductase [Aeoliella mucimassa]QDU55348.1 General stress protein 69 [Aeoliella mucimassa]